jgi:hypothetical protein
MEGGARPAHVGKAAPPGPLSGLFACMHFDEVKRTSAGRHESCRGDYINAMPARTLVVVFLQPATGPWASEVYIGDAVTMLGG